MGVIERSAFATAQRRYVETQDVHVVLEKLGMHDHDDFKSMLHSFAHEILEEYDPDTEDGCFLVAQAIAFGFTAGCYFDRLLHHWNVYGQNPPSGG